MVPLLLKLLILKSKSVLNPLWFHFILKTKKQIRKTELVRGPRTTWNLTDGLWPHPVLGREIRSLHRNSSYFRIIIFFEVMVPPPPLHCDITDLKLIQIIAVFAILHHPSKHQQPRPITHEAVGGTAGRNVASHCRDEPLVGGCRRGSHRQKFRKTIHLITQSAFHVADWLFPASLLCLPPCNQQISQAPSWSMFWLDSWRSSERS